MQIGDRLSPVPLAERLVAPVGIGRGRRGGRGRNGGQHLLVGSRVGGIQRPLQFDRGVAVGILAVGGGELADSALRRRVVGTADIVKVSQVIQPLLQRRHVLTAVAPLQVTVPGRSREVGGGGRGSGRIAGRRGIVALRVLAEQVVLHQLRGDARGRLAVGGLELFDRLLGGRVKFAVDALIFALCVLFAG